MATQVSPKPAGKHDTFIAAQLDRAERRIRMIDLAVGLSGFASGTLLYAIVVILLDRAVVLSAASRQTLLLFYALAAGVYLYLAVVRPLRWRVNPLYAARQIEQTLPSRRNHLVNWIDLQQEKLPGVIRHSLGQRTARDLSQTDVEQAISNRRAWDAGAAVALLSFTFFALILLFGLRPFGSLLERTFFPFGSSGVASRTQIARVRPESDDLVVTIGTPVTVGAKIDGRIPSPRDRDAPCLLWRHEPGEAFRKRYLQYDETNREWLATVAPLDVGTGFTYKLSAGDAETPEYRVSTRAAALLVDFLATYHHRPYVGRADRSKTVRRIEGLRGTEVEILARTNRKLKDGRLDFEATGGGGDIVRAELRPDDPRAMRFRLVLDRPGKYRLRFSSADVEGETYIDSIGHDVVVLPDQPPAVQVTRPDKDIEVPANGHVDLRGEVGDDIGIAAVTLRLRVVNGPVLQGLPYLADRLGKPDFGTPTQLQYRELLELPKLLDEAGKPFEVKPGMTLEYYLEARDGCDFPRANVAESTPRRRIVVTKAKDDPAEQKARDRSRQDKQKNDKKQSDEMKKQQADKQERRKQDEADERAEQNRREQQKGEQAGDNQEKKQGQEGKSEQSDNGKAETGKDDQTRKKAEEIARELDRRNEQKQGKEDSQPGEAKGAGQDKQEREQKPGENKDGGQEKPGAGRDEGKRDGKSGAGERKDAGSGSDSKPGEGRGEGKEQSKEPKGEGKGSAQDNPGKNPADKKPGEGKAGQRKPDKTPQGQGKGKDAGQGEPGGKAGQGKPEGSKPQDKQPSGEAKDSQTARNPGKEENRPGEGKAGADESKNGRREGEGKGKGEAKPGAAQSGQSAQDKAGTGKPPAGGQPGKGQPGSAKGGPQGRAKGGEKAPGSARGPGSAQQDGKATQPENATAQDAKARAEDLKSRDEGTRQSAARDLKEMADRARDPQARKEAGDALNKAREGFEKPDGAAKPPEAPPTPGKPEDATGKDVEELKKLAKGNPSAGQGWARKQLSDIANKAKDEKARQGARDALDEAWQKWLQDAQVRRQRDKPVASRPSALQLEEFRKKVDPNILKDLKMSREQFEQFLRDYADLTRRQNAGGDAPEKLPGVGQTPAALRSLGGKTVRPDKGASDDLRGSGRAKPPPEYRDSFEKFLRNIPQR